jgi:hypothetical protein
MYMATSKTNHARPPAITKDSEAGRKFILSFQAERFYKGVRYHWMVCLEKDPSQLVSWGHAPTQQMAEAAGQVEINDLLAGLSQGGQVVSTMKSFTRRR